MPDEAKATSPEGIKPALQRLDRIDLLRGVSILAVIFSHTTIFLPAFGVKPGVNISETLYKGLFDNGHYGVWMFFAISGFLITLTSLRRFRSLDQLKPATFYRIRFARIAPTLLATLAVLCILDVAKVPFYEIGPQFGQLRSVVFAALTFQINWLQGQYGFLPGSWLVFWSLSVEEMFYLFFPLACLLLRRRWSVPILVALLLLLLRLGPLHRWPAFHASAAWIYMSYLGNMDMIVIGCIFGFGADKLSRVAWQRATPLVRGFELLGLLTLLYLAVPSWDWTHLAFVGRLQWALGRRGLHVDAVAIATCVLMTGGVLRAVPGSRWSLPVRWMGSHSYEIYLSHMFVIFALNPYTLRWKPTLTLWLGTVVVMSALLGYLVSLFLSEPANRLLRGAPLPFQLKRWRKTPAVEPSVL
jgi:peptidoglycan/LPS O-acetylase OafA/YrhL